MSDTPKGPEVTDVASAANAIEAMLTGDGESETEEAQDEPEVSEDEPEAETADNEQDDAQPDDDAEDEAEDDGEAEEEAEPEEAKQPEKIIVKVDGEEVEVTVDELKAGYSRTADYTRKTMALAEERKAHEQASSGLEQERAQYHAVLEVWKQQLDASLGQDPPEELEQLRRQNPAEYAARVTDRQERERRLSAIMQEQTRLEQEESHRRTDEVAKVLRAEAERLMAAVPEWSNPEKAKEEREGIVNYAQSFGFTPQELAGVQDHRMILILRDAAKFRAIKEKAKSTKPEPKRATVKTASPGAAKSNLSSKSTNAERAKRRFGKTNHVNDAARLIEAMLPD